MSQLVSICSTIHRSVSKGAHRNHSKVCHHLNTGESTEALLRFVSFIAGSFTAVLLLASVVQPDLFVHFDITPHRNVLFYIGVFGAILAVSRALVPDDQQVFEPDILLRTVIEYTHYCPENWKGRFHSAEV